MTETTFAEPAAKVAARSWPATVRAVPLGIRTGIALALTSAVGLMAFMWPMLVGGESVLAHNASAPVVLAGVLLAVVLISIVALGDGTIDAKTVTMLGLLAAVGAVLRPLSAGSAGVEFVFLFIILGGRVFGAGFGFALGSITLFTSALLTGGFGPWLPFQMIAASWMGMGAGLLPRRMRGARELATLALFAAVSGFLFGQLMNLSFWPFTLGPGTGLSFVPGASALENLHHFALYSLTTSLGWDLMRAVVLALGVALLGRPVLSALRRTARIANFSTAKSLVSSQRHGLHGAGGGESRESEPVFALEDDVQGDRHHHDEQDRSDKSRRLGEPGER